MAHRFSSDVRVVPAAAAAVVAAALAAVVEAECLEAPYVQMSVACCGYVVLVVQVINQKRSERSSSPDRARVVSSCRGYPRAPGRSETHLMF